MRTLIHFIFGLLPLRSGVVAAAVAGGVASAAAGSMLASDNGAGKANAAAADAASTQAQIGLDQWDRYKKTYAPLEDKMVADAQNYDSPENFARAAGDASATVASQFGKARSRLSRTPGLDPSTPAFTASLTGLDLAQAATDATQQNVARQGVRDMGWARQKDAVSLGKGLPSDASGTLATSSRINAGLADLGYQRGKEQAAGLGNLVDKGIDAWSRSRATAPGLDTFGRIAGQGAGFTMIDAGSTPIGLDVA